jgi:hypothetical protein
MAAHTTEAPERTEAVESPLLVVFAVLIVVAMVPIGLVIAVPSPVTLAVALLTVMAFAGALAWLLGRMIGD